MLLSNILIRTESHFPRVLRVPSEKLGPSNKIAGKGDNQFACVFFTRIISIDFHSGDPNCAQ